MKGALEHSKGKGIWCAHDNACSASGALTYNRLEEDFKSIINDLAASYADYDVSEPVGNRGAQAPILPETTTPSEVGTLDAEKPASEGLEVGKNLPMNGVFNSEGKRFQFHLQNAKEDVKDYKIFMQTSERNCYESLVRIEELIGGDQGENLSTFSEKDKKKYMEQYNSVKKKIEDQFYAGNALCRSGDIFLSHLESSDFVSVPQDEKMLTQSSKFVRENMSQIKEDYDEIRKKYETLQGQIESLKTDLPKAIEKNKIETTKIAAKQSLETLQEKFDQFKVTAQIITNWQLCEASLSPKGFVAEKLKTLKDEKIIDNTTYKQCMTKLEEGSNQFEGLKNGETQLGTNISDAAQLPAKITEGMNKMEEIVKTGEGDVKACEEEIQKSLNTLEDCYAVDYYSGIFGEIQMESFKFTRGTLDSICDLIGEQNQGVFDALRKDLGLVDS